MTGSDTAPPLPTYREWMFKAAEAGQDLQQADLEYTTLINGKTGTQRRMMVQDNQLERNIRDDDR